MERDNIRKLISKAISSNILKILAGENIVAIRKLNNECKSSTEATQNIARYLVLETASCSQLLVKLNALHVLHMLFTRSKACRSYVCNNKEGASENILRILLKSAGISQVYSSFAVTLLSNNDEMRVYHRAVIHTINCWDSLFGSKYPELHVMGRYLRENDSRSTTSESHLTLAPLESFNALGEFVSIPTFQYRGDMNDVGCVSNRAVYSAFLKVLEDMKRNYSTVKSTLELLDKSSKIKTTHSEALSSEDVRTTKSSNNAGPGHTTTNALPVTTNHSSLQASSGMISSLRNLDRFLANSGQSIYHREASLDHEESSRIHLDDRPMKRKYDEVSTRTYEGDNDLFGSEADDDSSMQEEVIVDDINWVSSDEEDLPSRPAKITNNRSISTSSRNDLEPKAIDFDEETFRRTFDSLKSHVKMNISSAIGKWYTAISAFITLCNQYSRDSDLKKQYENGRTLLEKIDHFQAIIRNNLTDEQEE